MSGPDIGDQIQLLKASEGVILPTFPAVYIQQRIEYLRAADWSQAAITAQNTIARLEKEASEAAARAAVAVTDESAVVEDDEEEEAAPRD
jgi:hypothetical protein